MSDGPSWPPERAREALVAPRWETKLRVPPPPERGHAPGHAPAPLLALIGQGPRGGAGRGGALQPAEPPARPGLGSRRLGLRSPPAAAMEDERKDGAYGRSRLWPAAASAESGVPGGRGGPEIVNTPLQLEGPLLLPSPTSRSASSSRPLLPPGHPPIRSSEPPLPLQRMGRDARRMLCPGRSRYLGDSDARRGRGGAATGARKRDRA